MTQPLPLATESQIQSIAAALRRQPRHSTAALTIHRCEKNYDFIGLYSQDTNAWFMWLNDGQINYLDSAGVEFEHDWITK